jgi:hypothetical protein
MGRRIVGRLRGRGRDKGFARIHAARARSAPSDLAKDIYPGSRTRNESTKRVGRPGRGRSRVGGVIILRARVARSFSNADAGEGLYGFRARGGGRFDPSPATPTLLRRRENVSAYAADVASRRGSGCAGGDPSLPPTDRGAGEGRCPPARGLVVTEHARRHCGRPHLLICRHLMISRPLGCPGSQERPDDGPGQSPRIRPSAPTGPDGLGTIGVPRRADGHRARGADVHLRGVG